MSILSDFARGFGIGRQVTPSRVRQYFDASPAGRAPDSTLVFSYSSYLVIKQSMIARLHSGPLSVGIRLGIRAGENPVITMSIIVLAITVLGSFVHDRWLHLLRK